ncbi:MAG: CoA pyrophosphatase [Chitinophagales bacterium]|jgi:8-oxo-dGTP pyrophosphatase MutT (NUDIX family)|nr:CoA pyrophosphatase [Chitinophagales bacterium]
MIDWSHPQIIKDILSDSPRYPYKSYLDVSNLNSALIDTGSFRKAGIQVLFRFTHTLEVCMIRRQAGGHHAFQFGFPGGKVEPTDTSVWHASLRETQEEIGVSIKENQHLGALSVVPVQISKFLMYPFVSWIEADTSMTPSPDEVQAIHFFPFFELTANKRKVPMTIGSKTIQVKAFQYKHHIIWGASAIVLRELEIIFRNYTQLKS